MRLDEHELLLANSSSSPKFAERPLSRASVRSAKHDVYGLAILRLRADLAVHAILENRLHPAKHDAYGLAIQRLQTGDQSHSLRWRLFRRPHNALAGIKIFVRETVHGCFVQSRALSTAEDVSRALSTALLPRCRTPCKFGSRLAT